MVDRSAAAVRASLSIITCLFLAGCASAPLGSARNHFYAGRLAQAESLTAAIPEDSTDRLLVLMERGMIRQAAGEYETSAADWLKAAEIVEELETRSTTRQAASFIVNDRTVSFRGDPFERTLLRSFLAKNFLVRSMWQDAAVEARNIIEQLENLSGYPDDAYSRYVAGFCLEMMRDNSNAALQYRNANSLLDGLTIDPKTGQIERTRKSGGHELICFIAIGRAPTGRQSRYPLPVVQVTPYAEIYSRGKLLGRSHSLASTADLIRATKKKTAALRVAKDVTRIVVKQTVADKIKEKNQIAGTMAEILMYAFEMPDDRRWETFRSMDCDTPASHFGSRLLHIFTYFLSSSLVRKPL